MAFKSKFYMPGDNQDILEFLGQSLPDERPITAISIVEHSSKCPEDFFPILKTYDEDSDADLWKQQAIFGKRTSRYICISKSDKISNFKLIGICITGIGETPSGFSIIPFTIDSNKPAWRRRQLCCNFTVNKINSQNFSYITDIIVCSRLKRAPDGFQYAGEINGMLICFKTVNNTQNITNLDNTNVNNPVNYENISPKYSNVTPPERPPKTFLNTEFNKIKIQNHEELKGSNPDYKSLNDSSIYQPLRRAPPIPSQSSFKNQNININQNLSYSTLGNWNALEGITFILNSKLQALPSFNQLNLPKVKRKTLTELNQEYSYGFQIERQT